MQWIRGRLCSDYFRYVDWNVEWFRQRWSDAVVRSMQVCRANSQPSTVLEHTLSCPVKYIDLHSVSALLVITGIHVFATR